MKTHKSVIVKQLPETVTLNNAQQIRHDWATGLDGDRPCIVFDCSQVRQLDSAGIELLLTSLEEAMKRNGDVKLAAVSAPVSIILKLTRVDRLFEIFESPSDAVESFSRFPIGSLRTTPLAS